MSLASEGIALQSCENLQTFVWWWARKCVPLTIQMCVKFHDFEELCSHYFSTNHLSNRHPTTIAPKY